MRASTFGLGLALVAAAVYLLLWWLGFMIIAVAVALAVFAVGLVVYFAVSGGPAARHRHA